MAAKAAGGGIVCLPPGTYLLGTTLAITSNVTLLGAGLDVTTIGSHGTLGANRLIVIQGTPSSAVQNIRLRGFTLRNGTASTGNPIVGKDGIRAEHVDGLCIEECKFTEIQGQYGLVVKYATNVTVQRSHFYRWTYAGMSVLVESENIRVVDNVFDTAMSTATTNTYTFAT